MTMGDAVLLDTVIWVSSLAVLLVARQITHAHPALMYLVFHVFVISGRMWAIAGGTKDRFMQMTDAEAVRALQMADVLLVVMVVAWLLPVPERWTARPPGAKRLSRSVFLAVSIVAMPIGLYFLFTHTYHAGSGLQEMRFSTSYSIFAITWPGLLLMGAVYLWSFRWYFVVPLTLYLLFMALQGEGRFRLILPAILIAQIYLDRKGRRLPNLRVVVALGVLMILFVPLDEIGQQYREGTISVSSVKHAFTDSAGSLAGGDTSDQEIFDQYAVTLSASDKYGRPQWGEHFIDLLALPVPRPMWPDKPTTDEHLIAISTTFRPLATVGAVFTLPGELYTDWRWPGIVVGGFAIARLLLWLYYRAYARGYGSVGHFTYLLIAAALIQTYRDGLSTAPIFLLVQNAPLVVIAVLTWHWRTRDSVAPASDGSEGAGDASGEPTAIGTGS